MQTSDDHVHIASGGSLKKTFKPSAELPKLGHELIDQLSVINVCCFKISETFAFDPKHPTKTSKHSKTPYKG